MIKLWIKVLELASGTQSSVEAVNVTLCFLKELWAKNHVVHLYKQRIKMLELKV